MEKDLDKKLYNDYLNGEKQAFELLYNKYKSKIEYFIFNIVKDYQRAEDLTQETFIYVMQNRMKSDCSFKYFIYLVAKSKAFNCISLETRRNEIAEMYLTNNDEQAEKDVLEIITKEETKNELLEAIELLDEKYKNAVYLVNIEGLSYKETSNILGETLQNTKNLVHRGKKQLKIILLKKGFEEMNKVSKIIVLVLCVSILLSGIVYATTYVIKNIWREPEKFDWSEEIIVNSEDESKALTEGEIDKILSEKLNWLGLDKSNILDKQLVKFPYDKKMNWIITLDNQINFTLDALTGKLIQFSDSSFNDLEIKSTANENIAMQVAKELYEKLGYEDGEYEISTLKKNGTTEGESLWRVDFCKKYGDVYNQYQCIRISFVPEIKRIKILTVFDEEYEDNPIIISKEEAINIAKQRASQLKMDQNKLKSITAKLEIQEMNTVWYEPENNFNSNKDIKENTTEIKDTNTSTDYYRIPETVIRKVWTVTMDYSEEFASIDVFYIDVTTGEVIGGDTAI